ncbi:exosome subunit Rrp6P [Perkinsela sp. CCAP 1560/4]|nr:hypothetical protein XU18_4668 [Perkinsela sp. CCAP 1560/4]KNH06453.1 exosome subunit Rrp6P [Perkinsela sp. CCAP 1560/4]|eukprot:KNH03998.1 hypothetical protein XU18_4668 [Perkinsela sp. CCAP 1560/4]
MFRLFSVPIATFTNPTLALQQRWKSGKLAPFRKKTVKIAGCRNMCKFHYIMYGRHTRLRESHPELANEWDYEKNPRHLSPAIVINTTVQPMWWKCARCSTGFLLPIDQRTIHEKGCPNGCRPLKVDLEERDMAVREKPDSVDISQLLDGEKSAQFASRNVGL